MTAHAAAALWGGRIVRLISDRENAVYEMALPDGRAALRLHRPGYQAADAIQSELWLTDALAMAGVPVARPLPALDGSLLAQVGGRHASAIAWVDGAAMGEAGVPLAGGTEQSLDRHHALGRLLAQMHAVTAGLDLPPWFIRPRWDVGGLVGEAPFWGRFWEHPALQPAQADILRAARAALQGWLAGRPERLQPVHADVLRENVLCDGDRMVLIDFDDSGWGFPGYDLGTAMSQNLYEPARDDLRAALIDGYGALTVTEVDMFTLARVCASVGWAAPRIAPDNPLHQSHIARAVMWTKAVLG